MYKKPDKYSIVVKPNPHLILLRNIIIIFSPLSFSFFTSSNRILTRNSIYTANFFLCISVSSSIKKVCHSQLFFTTLLTTSTTIHIPTCSAAIVVKYRARIKDSSKAQKEKQSTRLFSRKAPTRFQNIKPFEQPSTKNLVKPYTHFSEYTRNILRKARAF